jgi:LysM repeat protein
MEKRTSALARTLAAFALVAAVIALVVVISDSQVNHSSDSSNPGRGHHAKKEESHHRTEAKTYVVQTGDTLTSIAHRTGVPVAELLALNPEVDPQILIAGETLKLR